MCLKNGKVMSKLYKCLLGLAVGDAIGLPYERMSLKKLKKILKI